jgi:copper homeostasis protein (lipoprotein)
MRKSACLLAAGWFALALLAGGCNRNPDAASAPGTAPGSAAPELTAPEPSERTWVGLLPCSDCQGIDTRLVLRSQGGRRSYLMVETYVGGTGSNRFERTGSWTAQSAGAAGEAQAVYLLDPDQDGQRFALQADGALELLDPDGRQPEQAVAYRLQRQ